MTPQARLVAPDTLTETAPRRAPRRTRRRPGPLPQPQRMVCKLCKRLVDVHEGVFFENARTGRLTDFQCRTCTRWELAPAVGPGNIRTDLVHYD